MQPNAGRRNVASIVSKGSQPCHAQTHFRQYATRRPPPVRARLAKSAATQAPQTSPASPATAAPAASDTSRKVQSSQFLPWILGSLLAGGIGFYAAALYVAANKPCANPSVKDLAGQKDVAGRYEDTADVFDSEVGVSEVLMGINRIRKRLARQATGHVLEVSCGTGRNIGYFDLGKNSSVESLTFVDLAPQMIDVCRKKWQALVGKDGAQKEGLVVRFLPASALGEMPSPPNASTRKYDTILQTMGLCSTHSPVALLENMTRYLNTGNPDARIFLLEHGKSYQEWLNRILDNSAEKHAELHGCWYNRDIGALVEEAAAKSGLEVVAERRHHLGTTWVFELKPKVKSTELQQNDPAADAQPPTRKWFSWYT